MIKCDASGTGHNPNDSPWNAAKRTLSFWVRSGELTQVTVYLTSSAGERQLRYKPGQSGTNSVDGSGHVTFFLPSDDTDDWMRIGRNIEADHEAHAGRASWSDTDGLGFVFGNAEESHIVYAKCDFLDSYPMAPWSFHVRLDGVALLATAGGDESCPGSRKSREPGVSC